jgi:hypothetical protein
MALSNLEKVRAYRERKKAAKAEATAALAATAGAGSKLARLAQLIVEAQALAAEINAEMVADLHSQTMTRETVRLLDSLEGKEMRVAFAKVDLPL